jgi:Na+(H+)/acetate symporter ActP
MANRTANVGWVFAMRKTMILFSFGFIIALIIVTFSKKFYPTFAENQKNGKPQWQQQLSNNQNYLA